MVVLPRRLGGKTLSAEVVQPVETASTVVGRSVARREARRAGSRHATVGANVPQPQSTLVPLPLDLSADVSAVQVLRVVRQLLVDGDHRASAGDRLSRMAAVLTTGTAIETLMRLAWERVVFPSERKDVNKLKAHDIEGDVLHALIARGLKNSDTPKALRNGRNMVAHDGSIPSLEDARRHATNARSFASDLVRAAWDADLERLTATILVENTALRTWLDHGYALLTVPDYTFVDAGGNTFPEPELDAVSLAAGLAHGVFDDARKLVKWVRLDVPETRFELSSNEGHRTSLHELIDRLPAFQDDVLDFALGVPNADSARFRETQSVVVTGLSQNWVVPSGRRRMTNAEGARFALDFVTDWILRAQPHFR